MSLLLLLVSPSLTTRTRSYPKYAASILAGNDLFRSTFASVFPHFGTKYFHALGIGGGSSLLAGVSILMIPLLYVRLASLPRFPFLWLTCFLPAAHHEVRSHPPRALQVCAGLSMPLLLHQIPFPLPIHLLLLPPGAHMS